LTSSEFSGKLVYRGTMVPYLLETFFVKRGPNYLLETFPLNKVVD